MNGGTLTPGAGVVVESVVGLSTVIVWSVDGSVTGEETVSFGVIPTVRLAIECELLNSQTT